jgi:SAM-dependent methyltransferase
VIDEDALMTFAVPAEAYDRFMGRYSVLLSPQLADVAGVAAGHRVLDVGCGPGALTGELVARTGAANVAAIDPSPPFVEAARVRSPGVDVRLGSAEELPFEDDFFDAALAQLVVHFMADPAAGVAEMRRVTRPGGVVVACVWDHAGGHGPISPLWEAMRDLDLSGEGESRLVGSREGDLHALFASAGLDAVEEVALSVSAEHPTFEEWWEPFTLGVGPGGGYVARLDADTRDALRERCRVILPPAPFTLTVRAWTARGVA